MRTRRRPRPVRAARAVSGNTGGLIRRPACFARENAKGTRVKASNNFDKQKVDKPLAAGKIRSH